MTDNLFEMGAHSLSAAQLLSRIRSLLRVDLPVSRIFERPTLASLAEAIAVIRAAPTSSHEIQTIVIEHVCPTPRAIRATASLPSRVPPPVLLDPRSSPPAPTLLASPRGPAIRAMGLNLSPVPSPMSVGSTNPTHSFFLSAIPPPSIGNRRRSSKALPLGDFLNKAQGSQLHSLLCVLFCM